MSSPSAYSKPGVGPIVPQMTTASPRRVATATSLGAIEEDGGMRPDVPARAANTPMARLFHLPFQTARTPPPYTEYNDVTGPRGEKFSDLRNNRHVTKRGGWTRLCVIALIALAVIVGLAVGLGVGMTRHKGSSSSSSSSSSPATQNPTTAFPVGAYTFDTYLASVSTACTPNSNTWRCFPYATYSETGSGADTQFNWIIAPSEANASNYVISSSENPFALDFTNASLTLTDVGKATEAYQFSTAMQKIVVPNVTLTADGATTSCFYNHTTFSAVLYTKMGKTYPSSNTTTSSSGGTMPGTNGGYQSWPYAVQVTQVVDGGSSVPDCYEMNNGNTVAHVAIGTESATQSCNCVYENYGT